jgi:G:T/U-mismatch repair DNA glycosylase
MDNDMDDWEIEVDNGQIEARILLEKRLEERRMQEESDNALTEDLFATDEMKKQIRELPTQQLQTSKKPQPKKKFQPQTTRLPVIPQSLPKKELSKSQKKRMEAELFGDSLYLTPEELAGCEFEEEYYK